MQYHGYYDHELKVVVQHELAFTPEEEVILPCPPDQMEEYMRRVYKHFTRVTKQQRLRL
jgi:hypothetical protein